MKIAIDARFYNESGIGRYLRNLISALQIVDKQSLRSKDLKKNQFFILLLPKDFENFKATANFKKVLAPFKWYGFAEQYKLPILLNQLNLDLVHYPHFNVPIFYKGKFVVTIHDLIHQHHVMNKASTLDPFTYKIKQFGYRKAFKYAVKNSSQIIVPSNFVKRGLQDEWKISIDKITITQEAVDYQILEIGKKIKREKILAILQKFNISTPFLFYVGNAHPHKNIERLIRVFQRLRNKFKNLKLVLSGTDNYFWQRIKNEYKQEGIIYTGFISDEELVAFYKSTQAFILPSLEEGFGIPILEAMSLGCLVVSSDAGSLKEVGGEAALYFNPLSEEEMFDKITKALNNPSLRKSLIAKGKKRAGLFSWEKMARQT